MPEVCAAMVVQPGGGPTIQGPAGGPLTFKVRGEQTGGSLTVLENLIASGDGPPLHTHADEDEAFYVLEGDVRYKLGAEMHAAPAGSFIFIPRGTPHCFQNVGTQPARLLVMFTPSGMERFFDRFAAIPDGTDPSAAFRSSAAGIGMEVVGPPLPRADER